MKTIFVLDSDFSQRNEMTKHLAMMGFAVRSFSTATGFENVNEKPFMIILDERMDNHDKFAMQFLKMVCRKMSRVPVIYMVNRVDKKRIHDAKKAGAYEVIEKTPAVFVNLRTALDRLEVEPAQNWFSKIFKKKLLAIS